MLSVFGVIVQVALIIAWYLVPAMAVIPAWVIFLPVIIGGAGLCVLCLFLLLGIAFAFLN